jgi:uncharacterized protein YxeA
MKKTLIIVLAVIALGVAGFVILRNNCKNGNFNGCFDNINCLHDCG